MGNVMRSRAYPSMDLGAAVQRVSLFNKNLGSTGSYERDAVAVGIGYKSLSGASTRAIGALVHYGLLERHKDKYSLSDLAKTILFQYETDEQQRHAIKEAAVNPSLFRELTEQYVGAEIPSLLSNILTSPKYGINPRVKDEVAAVYKATLDYAGLLKEGIVSMPGEPAENDFDDMAVTNNQKTDQAEMSDPESIASRTTTLPYQGGQDGVYRFEIPLGEGRAAAILAPFGLSTEEKEKLRKFIDLM